MEHSLKKFALFADLLVTKSKAIGRRLHSTRRPKFTRPLSPRLLEPELFSTQAVVAPA